MFSPTKRLSYALMACVFCFSTSKSLFAKEKSDGDIVAIEKNKTDKTPTAITFSQNVNWKTSQAQDIFKKYLGVDAVNTTMQLQYSTTTKLKGTADRYAQYFKGIKVEYGSYSILSKDGNVSFITGNYYHTDNTLSAVPSVS